jgi:enoyl-CoA hydratase/carnithine racemase
MMIMAVLQRVVPRRKLISMMLLGDKLSAAEAKDCGLLSHVTSAESLDETVGELADRLAAQSPTAMRLGLAAFHRQADLAIESAIPELQQEFYRLLGTEDAREGLMAFMERRTPQWTGR